MPDPGHATRSVDAPERQVELGPLPNLIGYMLRRAQLSVFQDFNRRFAEPEIRPADYGVLTIVAQNPGLRQSAIGEALGIARSNLVPLIERLRKRDLIHRSPVAADRRAYALTLTEGGKTVLNQLDRIRVEQETRLAEQIGRDRVPALLDMLDRLAAVTND